MSLSSLPSPLPRAPGDGLDGARVLECWASLPARARFRLLRGAARAVMERVRAGGRLDAEPGEFLFTPAEAGWRVRTWPPPRGPGRRPPAQDLLEWLTREWDALDGRLDANEGLFFLRAALRADAAPRRAPDAVGGWIAAEVRRHRHRRARRLAAAAREEPVRVDGAYAAVDWPGGPAPRELAGRVAAWLADPAATVLKESPEARVVLAREGGRAVVVKVYPVARGIDRFKDLWRAPRALRAWTAARVFQALGLPAPRPLAVLLDARVGGRRCHAYVSEFIEGALTAREWIRPRLHRAPPAFRARVARQLRLILDGLERAGVVHGDTKASNILVRPGPDGLAAEHWWIDLEAVRFDRPPGPRLLARNLVQLNGSVGQRLAREDRLAFLAAYAATRPWAREPGLAGRIERLTRLRLRREVRGECGS